MAYPGMWTGEGQSVTDESFVRAGVSGPGEESSAQALGVRGCNPAKVFDN